jgi:hypothetical protein
LAEGLVICFWGFFCKAVWKMDEYVAHDFNWLLIVQPMLKGYERVIALRKHILILSVCFLLVLGYSLQDMANASPPLLGEMYQMGEARQTDALDYLLAKLEDPDATSRRIAARALGKIGDPAAVQPLLELAEDPGQPATVRSVAMSSLARMKCISALPCLERIELSGNHMLKTKARHCIERITHK